MNRILPRFDAYISTEGTNGSKNSISHSEGEDDLAIPTQPVDVEKNSNIGEEFRLSTPVVSPLTYGMGSLCAFVNSRSMILQPKFLRQLKLSGTLSSGICSPGTWTAET